MHSPQESGLIRKNAEDFHVYLGTIWEQALKEKILTDCKSIRILI